jgi:hypothetical protein
MLFPVAQLSRIKKNKKNSRAAVMGSVQLSSFYFILYVILMGQRSYLTIKNI